MNISAVPTTNMILKMEQDSLLKNTKASIQTMYPICI